MARPKGSRTVLVRINYDTIGELAGGIAGNTVRQYAQRGQFNPRSLDSALSWINDRRIAKGLPLIGAPTDVDEAVSDDDAKIVTSTPPPVPTGLLMSDPAYDARTATYRYDT